MASFPVILLAASLTTWVSQGLPQATPRVAALQRPFTVVRAPVRPAMPAEPTLVRDQRLREARQRAEKLGLGDMVAAQRVFGGVISREWAEAAGSATKTPGSLIWPVRDGVFVRGFGAGSGGYHLAVDIAGPRGLPVRAAARGVVAYAGNGLRGYGNIVMVVHPGGWATMYAHNETLHVRAGEMVRAGSLLADVGNTGISRGPHVHFEFMFNRRNCDPTPLFQPGIHHGRGRYSGARGVFWRRPESKPNAIQCTPRRQHPSRG